MALAPATLRVQVVSADRMVWEGEAESVIARTVEGDIGILPHHEPLLAALVPCAAEVLCIDGQREIFAVKGGFMSVDNNRVALISSFARLATEISVADAEREHAAAVKALEAGDNDPETMAHLHRSEAALKAAHKVSGKA